MKVSHRQKQLLIILHNGRYHATRKFHTITIASATYRGWCEFSDNQKNIKITNFGKEVYNRVMTESYNAWRENLRSAKRSRSL